MESAFIPNEAVGPDAGNDSAAQVVALLTKHHSFIFRYLLASVCDLHEAEDLHQEVSIFALTHFDPSRADANFKAWIREVCRHRVMKYFSRTHRSLEVLSEEALSNVEQALERVSYRSETLRECLDTLGALARRVVHLRYAEDLEVGGIAETIGRTLTVTYGILKRARWALYRCMQRKTAAEQP